MFGIRVLLFLVGIALVVWILLRMARPARLSHRPARKLGGMVSCKRCATFVPREEAIRDGNDYYCSTRHRDEDR
jgi:uncharacterized protein